MDAALSHLAGDISLQIGPDVARLCRGAELHAGSAGQDTLTSWLCKDRLFFTLFKLGQGSYVYSHANKVLYHASPGAQLSPACPSGTGFLCQFTHDALPEGLVPRLLAFDLISDLPAGERGEALRAHAPHLPQPLCAVQWVGPRRYLSKDFIAGLPHAIEGILCYGDDPLRVGVVREF